MADLDRIGVCRECLHPVEGSGSACPGCGGGLWLGFPVLMLATVRRLAAKGWTVTKAEDDEAGPGNAGGFVRLMFAWMAPPIPRMPQGGSFVVPELPRYETPCAVATWRRHGTMGPAREMAAWASEAPRMAVPFSQDFCDRCRPQGADWFFGVVKGCPAAGGDVRFADGLPDRCAYAAEQVMTREARVRRLERLEGWSKISRRLLERERGMS